MIELNFCYYNSYVVLLYVDKNKFMNFYTFKGVVQLKHEHLFQIYTL